MSRIVKTAVDAKPRLYFPSRALLYLSHAQHGDAPFLYIRILRVSNRDAICPVSNEIQTDDQPARPPIAAEYMSINRR